MTAFLRRILARVRHRRYADALAEELEHHRQMLERDLVERGVSDTEARWRARRALGNEALVKEDARAVWLAPWFDQTWQDVRYAWRQMRRAPAFTVTAVLLSALGVAATTAVFSVANAVLFVPLPYPEPYRILALGTTAGGAADGRTYHAVQTRNASFSALAAQRQTGGWSLVAGPYAEAVRGLRVSDRYLDVVGVAPRLGRGLSREEDTRGGPDAVVISDDLWRRAFGGRPDVVGQSVLLGGTPHAVVGVMPSGFRSTPQVDVWTPIRLSERDNSLNYLVLGRLAPGILAERAAAELELAKADLMRTEPEPMHARTRTLSWQPLQQRLGFELAFPMLLLILAVAAVSTVACANLTGLLLFRTLAREREVSTRLALGGSRGRVIRQLLTESLVLAGVGGVVGLVAVAWLLPLLAQAVPAAFLAGRRVTLDWRVLAVALNTTILVGVVFGLAPALAMRRFDLRQVLAQGRSGSAGTGHGWGRRVLLASEIAATATLLVLGGMVGTSLVRMSRAPLGFEPRGVTIGRVSLAGDAVSTPDAFRAFAARSLEAIHAVPGVEDAALASTAPVERGLNLPVDPPTGSPVTMTRSVDWRYVSPDYFRALRMVVRQGRVVDDRDGPGTAPVVVVNEAFARAYFARTDVVGEVVRMHESLDDPPRQIVGVVEDAVSAPGAGWTRGFNARGAAPPPILYVSLAQAPAAAVRTSHQLFPATWIVRTRPGTGDIGPALTRAVRSVAPSLAFVNVEPLSQMVEADLNGLAVLATVVGALAVAALLIAAIGIFGVVTYVAGLRRHDTAIRLALGASRATLMQAFVRDTILIVLVGGGAGVALSLGASRLLQMAVGPLAALDSAAVVGAVVLLATVAMLAGLVPAARASQADPLVTLRDGA